MLRIHFIEHSKLGTINMHIIHLIEKASPLLRTRPNGIAICPGFLFRLCPGCPGFDTGFILKINQNVHLFIFSTISELFNVY